MSKKNLYIILIVCLVIVTGIYFFNSFKPENIVIKKGLNNKNVSKDLSEAEKLKALNRDIMNQAKDMNADESIININDTDHILGDLKKAKVTMVVYGDFENKFSSSYAKTIKSVREKYGDDIVIAYRHFYFKSEQNTILSAIASECAAEQDKFWEMYYKLYNIEDGIFGEEKRAESAKSIGLDMEKYEQCMKEEKYMDKIVEQKEKAEKAYILGVPVSFINGEKIIGDSPMEDFIDSAGYNRKGLINIIDKHLEK
ncbi:thioredoxin domain-containing protein [Candidatus Parcubacteria bacterium]|nr:thioredoxin domain-containing protein [Candidatus Parcubacteria bacterium]